MRRISMKAFLRRYSIIIGYPLCAVMLALVLSSGLILAVDAKPSVAFYALLKGAFGNTNSLAETLVKATPLLLAALGMCAAFQCRIWNIGAEGQLYIGALATAIVGIYVPFPSKIVAIPVLLLVSFLAGGCWAAIPGWLKARFGVSEIITTIMMNYIAIFLISYAVHHPLRDPQGYLPQSSPLQASASLPVLLGKTRLHLGIVIGVLGAVLLYIVFKNTTLGYQIRVVGHNPLAARYGGIHVGRVILGAMIMSGGFAGMAGMAEVAGVHHRLLEHISPGYGYTAIVVALLSYLHPLLIILVSVLFAGLMVGADSMQRMAGLPAALAFVVQGLVVLFVLGSEYFVKKRLQSGKPAR
ncbi:ABC transporter permease [candidate division KSB3 bacterium]|uniref:ABC transporter permease n=1 Tax=candidate division KSB3 bacterium TaxID=2044937 RepID=A0A9D5JVM6_9BACT|nr:ABC transporter permease [candidate division KSB3 bacterium]MBD3324985.1 ABC transporter permease [candidate division KSB3 bacterium]